MSDVICPTCGAAVSRELPVITPERLFFLVGEGARTLASLPSGDWSVAADGRIWALRALDRARYEAFCASAREAGPHAVGLLPD